VFYLYCLFIVHSAVHFGCRGGWQAPCDCCAIINQAAVGLRGVGWALLLLLLLLLGLAFSTKDGF